MFNDMNLFVYKSIPVTMPDYLTPYSGDSRLQLCLTSLILNLLSIIGMWQRLTTNSLRLG